MSNVAIYVKTMNSFVRVPCDCPSPLYICHFEVGCICPRNTNCDIYPEHPEYKDDPENLVEIDHVDDQMMHLGISLGGSVIIIFLVTYIIVVIIKIAQKKRKESRSRETIEAKTNTEANVNILPCSRPSGDARTTGYDESSIHESLPITSVSQLIEIHQLRKMRRDSVETFTSDASNNTEAVTISHQPSPMLSSILMVSNSSVSSRSISINFDDDEEEDSDNSYDHLDHHRSLNDFASNYCQ